MQNHMTLLLNHRTEGIDSTASKHIKSTTKSFESANNNDQIMTHNNTNGGHHENRLN